MSWNGMKAFRVVSGDEGRNDDELRRAYEEGREDGWREAMEESQRRGRYGERNLGNGGGHGNFSNDDGYSERGGYGRYGGRMR